MNITFICIIYNLLKETKRLIPFIIIHIIMICIDFYNNTMLINVINDINAPVNGLIKSYIIKSISSIIISLILQSITKKIIKHHEKSNILTWNEYSQNIDLNTFYNSLQKANDAILRIMELGVITLIDIFGTIYMFLLTCFTFNALNLFLCIVGLYTLAFLQIIRLNKMIKNKYSEIIPSNKQHYTKLFSLDNNDVNEIITTTKNIRKNNESLDKLFDKLIKIIDITNILSVIICCIYAKNNSSLLLIIILSAPSIVHFVDYILIHRKLSVDINEFNELKKILKNTNIPKYNNSFNITNRSRILVKGKSGSGKSLFIYKICAGIYTEVNDNQNDLCDDLPREFIDIVCLSDWYDKKSCHMSSSEKSRLNYAKQLYLIKSNNTNHSIILNKIDHNSDDIISKQMIENIINYFPENTIYLESNNDYNINWTNIVLIDNGMVNVEK